MEKVSVVAVYIEQDGKVLMVQEKGQAWGLWSFPMGHVDAGEKLEEAAKREVKEETGYDIKITKNMGKRVVSDTEYKGGEKDKGKQIEMSFFNGKILGGQLKSDLEVLDVKWIGKTEALRLPLRGGWMKELLNFYR